MRINSSIMLSYIKHRAIFSRLTTVDSSFCYEHISDSSEFPFIQVSHAHPSYIYIILLNISLELSRCSWLVKNVKRIRTIIVIVNSNFPCQMIVSYINRRLWTKKTLSRIACEEHTKTTTTNQNVKIKPKKEHK